jgi:hypothetical protein
LAKTSVLETADQYREIFKSLSQPAYKIMAESVESLFLPETIETIFLPQAGPFPCDVRLHFKVNEVNKQLELWVET